MLDNSEKYFKELSHTIINIYKLYVEEMGYDMGDTNNDIEYKNYLIRDPIIIDNKYNNNSKYPNYTGENADIDVGNLNFGNSLDGVFIPDSVKANQKLGKCPQNFIDDVTRASKITGIPVSFYIAFGALESGWRNCAPNSAGYGGYFGQKSHQGGTGTAFEQAQGIMVSIYRDALKEAQKHNWGGADLAVWCYLCHNAGPAGAKTMLNALGGNLRHSSLDDYKKAAMAFVNAHGQRWSYNTQISQIKEKMLSIPKAYYIVSQIS